MTIDRDIWPELVYRFVEHYKWEPQHLGPDTASLYRKVRSTIKRSGNRDFALDKRYYAEGFVRGFSPRKLLRGEDLLLCAISGGGSALLAARTEGITLADKVATTTVLLRAGARIDVRAHRAPPTWVET